MDDFEDENIEPEPKVEELKLKKPRKKQLKLKIEEPQIPIEEPQMEPELLGPIDDDEIVNLTKTPKVKVKPKLVKPKKRVVKTPLPEIAEKPAVKPKFTPKAEENPIEIKFAKPEMIESKTEKIEKEAGVAHDISPEIKSESVNIQLPQSAPEQPVKKSNPGVMKWFIGGAAIAAILMVALFFLTLHNINGSYFPDNPNAVKVTGLAVYEPTDLLKGWTLNDSRTNLAEVSSDLRSQWMQQGIKDAAMWHYTKGAEDLYVWLRVYPDKATLEKNKDFTSMFVWDSVTNLGIGDNAIIGGYKAGEGKVPLLVYVAKDNRMFYASYYNQNGNYNATSLSDDEHFLVSFARDMLSKLDGGVQQSLNNSEVNASQ
jgi:hypothetical protein